MDRKADPQTQLMIDEAILDYLCYTAIRALLSAPKAGAHIEDSAQQPLYMVGTFLTIFSALHPNHHAPAEIRFRLRLLQFCCFFKRRRRVLSTSPYLSGTSDRQNLNIKAGNHHTPTNIFIAQPDDIHLKETLPMFLALSAAQNSLQESTITELWMRLAAGYMAHAYAEQVLSFHDTRSGLLEEIFHWSFDPSWATEQGSDEGMIKAMFNADKDIIRLWEDIKGEHVRALQPPAGISLTAHLKAMVSSGLSVPTFEEKISEFLSGLLSAHPVPLLTQLEDGKIDGLSTRSTAALKRRAGFV